MLVDLAEFGWIETGCIVNQDIDLPVVLDRGDHVEDVLRIMRVVAIHAHDDVGGFTMRRDVLEAIPSRLVSSVDTVIQVQVSEASRPHMAI